MSKGNKRCPCGSGRKHKNCCGKESREIPLGPQEQEMIEAQLQRFREKFGREPGPGDPIFFDPDSDTPVPFNEAHFTSGMVDLMRKAGIPDELIYAFSKTGMLLTDQNMNQFSQDDIDEWTAAIEEYRNRPDKN